MFKNIILFVFLIFSCSYGNEKQQDIKIINQITSSIEKNLWTYQFDSIKQNLVNGLKNFNFKQIVLYDKDLNIYHYVYYKNGTIEYEKSSKNIFENSSAKLIKKDIRYNNNQLGTIFFYINNNSTIFLTKAQNNYLNSKKEIKVCVDPNWMPFEKIENKEYIGLGADYMKLISQMLDKPINLAFTESWAESISKAKKRKCDIIAIMQKTTKRLKYMDFTPAYISTPLVLATKIGKPFSDNLLNILHKRLGVVKGYALVEELTNMYPTINIVLVDSVDDGLKKVEDGKLFGYLDNSIVMNYYIQNNYLSTLSISGKFKKTISLSIASRNDEPLLNEIFSKAIASIDSSSKQKILNQWVNVNYAKFIDYTLVWQIIIFASIVILFFLYRQYDIKRLNKKLQKDIQIAIKESKEKDIMIFQQSKLASMGNMIANISHQWRQPLSSLNGIFVNLDYAYENDKLDKSTFNKAIDEAETLTSYMSNTIEDFSNFFSPTKQREIFNINELLESTKKMLSSSLIQHQISLIINVQDSIDINSYKSELVQVLLILINNAKDAFKSKNIKDGNITINLVDTKNDTVLTIEDNAGGILNNIVESIFEPYFTTKHKSVGTGLGLYIANTIVTQSLNGELTVENINQGAKFIIKLKKQTIS